MVILQFCVNLPRKKFIRQLNTYLFVLLIHNTFVISRIFYYLHILYLVISKAFHDQSFLKSITDRGLYNNCFEVQE